MNNLFDMVEPEDDKPVLDRLFGIYRRESDCKGYITNSTCCMVVFCCGSYMIFDGEKYVCQICHQTVDEYRLC